jgi:hypothetical protein
MKSDAEFLRKAMSVYENIQCNTLEEFNEDLNRFSTIRKMVGRYKATNEISTRLLLNHVVVIFNVFGQAAVDMFLYKISREHYSIVFPFIKMIDRVTDKFLLENKIELDQRIIEELRKL